MPEARRRRATKLANEPGGVTKAPTLSCIPQRHHPRTAAQQVPLRRPDRDFRWHPGLPHNPPGHQQGGGQVLPSRTIQWSPQSAPESFSLRFSYLQDALSDELVENATNFVEVVYFSTSPRDLFLWVMNTAANLSAPDMKARPVAFWDVLRRTFVRCAASMGSSWGATSSPGANMAWRSWRSGGQGARGHPCAP